MRNADLPQTTNNNAIFNQTTLLSKQVIWLVIRAQNQSFINYWPSFGYILWTAASQPALHSTSLRTCP